MSAYVPVAQRCVQCARYLGRVPADAVFCETCEDRHDAEEAEARVEDEFDRWEPCPGYRED